MAGKIKIAVGENTRVLTIGIAIALATLILSYHIYRSHSNKIKELHSAIDKEEHRLVIGKDIAKLNGIIKEYRKYFHKKDINIYALRNIISGLGRDAGVNIVSMQPLEPEKFGNYAKVSCRVKLKSSYSQLGKFLEKLEGLTSLTKIEEINLSEGMEGIDKAKDFLGGGTKAEVSLVIGAYCLES